MCKILDLRQCLYVNSPGELSNEIHTNTSSPSIELERFTSIKFEGLLTFLKDSFVIADGLAILINGNNTQRNVPDVQAERVRKKYMSGHTRTTLPDSFIVLRLCTPTLQKSILTNMNPGWGFRNSQHRETDLNLQAQKIMNLS